MKPTAALVLASVAALAGGDAVVSLQTTEPPNPSTTRDLEAAAGGAAVGLFAWTLLGGKKGGRVKAALFGAAAGWAGGRIGFPGLTK